MFIGAIGSAIGSFLGSIVSKFGLWFGIFRAGQKSMEARLAKENAEQKGKQLEAEQETPHDPKKLSDSIRRDPDGF